jgi:hypothetical protein
MREFVIHGPMACTIGHSSTNVPAISLGINSSGRSNHHVKAGHLNRAPALNRKMTEGTITLLNATPRNTTRQQNSKPLEPFIHARLRRHSAAIVDHGIPKSGRASRPLPIVLTVQVA